MRASARPPASRRFEKPGRCDAAIARTSISSVQPAPASASRTATKLLPS